MKKEGTANDLLDRIAGDKIFGMSREELDKLLEESCFTGMALEQTEAYLEEVRAMLESNRAFMGQKINADIKV